LASNFPDDARGKLRIVHVFRAPLGGLFRHVVDLAGEQTARGHDVGMFFDCDGLSPRVDEALATIPGGLRLGFETAPIRRNPGPSDCVALARFGRWRLAACRARPRVEGRRSRTADQDRRLRS
jgi:hypothetical protein